MIPRLALCFVFLVASAFAEAKTPAVEPGGVRTQIDALSADEIKQAIEFLKSNYLDAPKLNDAEIERATLQGLLERLAPGAELVAEKKTGAQANPFRLEIIHERIGYARLGSLTKNNIEQLDHALKKFSEKPVKSLILDLRATPPSSDFELAAEVVKRFSRAGQILFTIKKSATKNERVFTSEAAPEFSGLLVVIADSEASGAAEVIAAALRAQAKALLVGNTTAGAAADFAELSFAAGKKLRVAVAEVALPDAPALFPGGVKPDIAAVSDARREEVLRLELEQGVGPFINETERPHMNEAALVAGRNPELDALQAAQKNKSGQKSQTKDAVLQRAVDVILSIDVFEKSGAR